MPHSRSTGWESKANSYRCITTYQCPLLVGDRLSKEFLVHFGTLLGIVGDLFEVSLALEKTASRLLDITLAWKDYCPRVPDRAEATRLPIYLLFRNKYFGTFILFGLSTKLQVAYQEVI